MCQNVPLISKGVGYGSIRIFQSVDQDEFGIEEHTIGVVLCTTFPLDVLISFLFCSNMALLMILS